LGPEWHIAEDSGKRHAMTSFDYQKEEEEEEEEEEQ
jgi:hypothetical protein